ncbi:hypothetical protein [Silvanigrella aquatica]|uniref:Uncharacterized protein n=1 Tax=Silvanigrella aquatica TaxID=1915309 RepID=A0A1L4CYR4_9BACT|nr:hypothetical protein [Silvanigrella aquatica]APJ03094.1 hypothetical protein AXG55_03895 [Silvanigrella aquatica]
MFDKNDFKEKFRKWTELNPNASYEEAKLLCDILIPINAKEQYYWLEEQSIAWFLWKKETRAKTQQFSIQFENEDEIANSYFDQKKIM